MPQYDRPASPKNGNFVSKQPWPLGTVSRAEQFMNLGTPGHMDPNHHWNKEQENWKRYFLQRNKRKS